MKFFICALAVCTLSLIAQASVVLSPTNRYSASYGPRITVDNSQPIVVHAPSVIPAATHLYRTPLIVPVGLNAEGTYVAKTLGSEHIASLPGHFISTSSINLEQAPGVIKDEIKDSSSLVPSVALHHGASFIPGAFPLTYSTFIAPAPIVLPTEAKYVAKNLGVEHVAPLPGHFISATSLNLEPAPGSK